MSLRKVINKKWKTEVVVALIGLIGVLGAAIIGAFDKWFPRSTSKLNPSIVISDSIDYSYQKTPYVFNQSASELINILNLRAASILDTMEIKKQEALKSIQSGRGYDSEDEIVQKYSDIRKLFLELHQKNIEAIKNDQFILSHEITSDIHYYYGFARETHSGELML